MNQSESGKFISDMSTGSIVKQLILFSLPLAGINLLQMLCQAAEMMILGRYNGASGMAGLNICYVIYGLLTMSAVGFSFGGPILLAQQSGSGDYGMIQKTVRSLLLLSFCTSAAFGLAGFLFRDSLLTLVHTPSLIYADARFYLSASCLTLLLFTINNVTYSVFRGLGNSITPLLLVSFQSAVDILLNLLLTGRFHFGLRGAAAAMFLSQLATMLMAVFLLLKYYRPLLSQKSLSGKTSGKMVFPLLKESFPLLSQKNTPGKTSGDMVFPIIKISLPIILFGILMSVSAIFINSNVNTYGAAASAADGIGNQLKNFVSAVSTGLYQGATIMIAQSFGKRDIKRIRQIFRRTILIGMCICVLLAAAVLVFPKEIFGWFTEDPSVIDYAGNCLLCFAVSFVGLFLASGPFALLEGIGNTRLESISGVIENFAVRILLGYLLGKIFGLYGYWLGNALASFVMPAIGYVYYRIGHWEIREKSYPGS